MEPQISEAGGCLDGKQHLAVGELQSAAGVSKMINEVGLGAKAKNKPKPGGGGNPKEKEVKKVEPETPLALAKELVEKILKDMNECRCLDSMSSLKQ